MSTNNAVVFRFMRSCMFDPESIDRLLTSYEYRIQAFGFKADHAKEIEAFKEKISSDSFLEKFTHAFEGFSSQEIETLQTMLQSTEMIKYRSSKISLMYELLFQELLNHLKEASSKK